MNTPEKTRKRREKRREERKKMNIKEGKRLTIFQFLSSIPVNVRQICSSQVSVLSDRRYRIVIPITGLDFVITSLV